MTEGNIITAAQAGRRLGIGKTTLTEYARRAEGAVWPIHVGDAPGIWLAPESVWAALAEQYRPKDPSKGGRPRKGVTGRGYFVRPSQRGREKANHEPTD